MDRDLTRMLAQGKLFFREWPAVDSEPELEEVFKGFLRPINHRARMFEIEAETAAGRRLFQAYERLHAADLQSEFIDDTQIMAVVHSWGKAGAPSQRYGVYTHGTFGSRVIAKRNRPAEARANKSPNSKDVLARLSGSRVDSEAMRLAVLDAEVTAFSSDEVGSLCECLEDFILKMRFSSVPEDLVAVGSAVRKYIVYLSRQKIGAIARFLEVGPRGPVPLDVELEVSKAVLAKLKAAPEKHDSEPLLVSLLTEIAATYTDARLLSREKFGATALNATLSLALLRSDSTRQVIKKIQSAKQSWYSTLVVRRAVSIRDDLRSRFASELIAEWIESLDVLISHASKKT
jgi:hypothetical protein